MNNLPRMGNGRLALTRHAGEAVILTVPGTHQRVRIEVHRFRSGPSVVLTFEAPPEVEIWREEIQGIIDARKDQDS